MRTIAGGAGVVFDIYEAKLTPFIENYEYLKGREQTRMDFHVERCNELPELDEDGQGDSAWRNTGGGGGFGGRNNGGYSGGGGY
jgi:uncharacterized membrane protein YgcG